MRLKLYQVDAFARRPFEGNPAAVVPLEAWPDDALLANIAAENNLSETAFLVPTARGWRLRWFTPLAEVDLCGHATLATAFVLFRLLGHPGPRITFETRSGDLTVSQDGDAFIMDFPARPPLPHAPPPSLVEGLGVPPLEVLAADDWVAVYGSEEVVRSIRPDYRKLSELGLRGVLVTAPGKEWDFVSRCFFPALGIDEDPVTGSAHCELAPYWAARLGRKSLSACQLSRRGGEVLCQVRGHRVLLTGRAVLYLEGAISV